MTTPIETLATSIASKSFVALLTNLVGSYFSRKNKSIGQNQESVTTDLKPHIESTFERCLNIKTIINDAAVNLLSIYVEQRFSHRGEAIDQYELIDRVRNGHSIVITGTGGGGKSMFMRYLWLSFFVHSENKIPVFFELRQINSATHDSFVNHLYHSIIQTKATITQKQFDDAISKGEFILFLDGFDEISIDKRDSIERQILSLKDNNPKTNIIITSRPDDRFSGWHRFDNAEVSPLTKEDSILLVERAQYDDTSKKRLTKRIKSGLFETHESFLSNPLLVYMMLLTIARNPDIPNRMHAFYEMAFDALYHRHDTSKGGFIRQFHTRLEKHQFIKHLSYFCLITYHDEVTETDEQTITEYAEKAIKFDNSTTNPADYLRDLVDSICIIKKDGLQYNFIHRSFQEYFAAVCICRYASRNLEKMFLNFSRRYNDKVLSMVYDMAPDLFREKYVIPIYNRYMRYLDGAFSAPEDEQFMREAGIRFVAHKIPEKVRIERGSRGKKGNGHRKYSISLEGSNDLFGFYSNINNIEYVNSSTSYTVSDEEREKRALDDEFFSSLSEIYSSPPNIIALYADERGFALTAENEDKKLPEPFVEKFGSTFMSFYCRRDSIKVRNFVQNEISGYNKVTDSFEQYF